MQISEENSIDPSGFPSLGRIYRHEMEGKRNLVFDRSRICEQDDDVEP